LEDTAERIKVTVRLRFNWAMFALHTAALISWVVMLGVVLRYIITAPTQNLILTALLVLWILVWLWFGRFIWRRWQYHAARREILYADDQQLLLRRPVSILGSTHVYDRQHVGRFYYSEKHQSLAFDYTYIHVYFAPGLDFATSAKLIDLLNDRLFPGGEQP
jgi:hypothetical protein